MLSLKDWNKTYVCFKGVKFQGVKRQMFQGVKRQKSKSKVN